LSLVLAHAGLGVVKPGSYYNPLHYGREFMLVEHTSMLAVMAGLSVRGLRGRENGARWRGPVDTRCSLDYG
jgi:hypothetical protein